MFLSRKNEISGCREKIAPVSDYATDFPNIIRAPIFQSFRLSCKERTTLNSPFFFLAFADDSSSQKSSAYAYTSGVFLVLLLVMSFIAKVSQGSQKVNT